MSFALTVIFIILVVATTVIRLWLASRHIQHVQQHRTAVPEAFADTISLSAHQKAADYTKAKSQLGLADMIVSTIILLIITVGGGLQWIDMQWREVLPDQTILRGALVIVSTLLLSSLVDIPFSYYQKFTVDERFGFNKMSPKMFFTDLVKQTFVSLLIGGPVLFVALWLMQSAGEYWWLYLWVFFTGFNLLMFAIYPTYIAPLFNKFTPLEDMSLKSRIETLLTKCGFKSQGLFVMDGSARSSHGNAYFTGFGSSKRVVFFDTLLERLDENEIEAVLAHELGHFKHNHVTKRMVMMFAMSFVGLAILGWLINQPWFYNGLGVTEPSNYTALILFMIVSPVFTFFLGPLMAYYSRQNEFEADDYAAKNSRAQWLVEALVKLYRDNASTLTPDPLHSAFYDSHPPASVRINKLSTYLN